MDAIRLRLGSNAASVHSFEVTPDAEGSQVRGFVATAARTKLEVVRGHVVAIAYGAGTFVAIALVDMVVLMRVPARDYRAPDHQEVFTQAAEQRALGMLAGEHPTDVAIQEQCRFVDPETKPYPADAEAVAWDVSMVPSVRAGWIGSART